MKANLDMVIQLCNMHKTRNTTELLLPRSEHREQDGLDAAVHMRITGEQLQPVDQLLIGKVGSEPLIGVFCDRTEDLQSIKRERNRSDRWHDVRDAAASLSALEHETNIEGTQLCLCAAILQLLS